MSVQRSSFRAPGIVFVVASTVGFLVTCGPPPKYPVEDLCEDVICAEDQYCDAADGRCKEGDEPPDAGSEDAGSTTTMDGGQDAGTHCSPECSGVVPVCDPASQSCKVCIIEDTAGRDPGCTESAPKCYPTANNGLGGCYQCRDDFDCEVDEYCNTNAGFCEPMEPTDGGSDVDGGTEVDGGTVMDGGEISDGGEGVDGGGFDGGEVPDGGEVTDGGGADAGELDAGVVDGGFVEPYPDTCDTRAVRHFDGGLSLSWPADNSLAADDYNGQSYLTFNCQTASDQAGPDLVYEIVLDTAAALTVQIAPDQSGNALPMFYMRDTDCEGGVQIMGACGNAARGFAFTTPTLQPGSYYLFFDALTAGSAGPANITVVKN